MNRRWPLLLALVGSLGLGACHRSIFPTKTATAPPKPVAPEVKARNLDFTYLSAKGKAQIDANGEKYSANVNLRMRKDSVIWLSASLLGVEGVRAMITPDSVQVINKLEKTYYAGNFSYLTRQFNVPVTFTQMQALLLGDYLPAASDNTGLRVSNEGPVQKVNYQQASVLVEQLIDLSRSRVQKLTVQDVQTNNSVTVTYADFKPLEKNAQLFAHGTLVEAQQPGRPAAVVSISYRNVDLDKERLDFPFSVPAAYGRKNRK
ncbi:DUF4292 domain-containing protein [Hymenobacter busanensis]|nr:DUF4292 domain-containing protein [Hymenobacter busanensis]QHJ07792.1 DUF4292 domain-containing protein [Hymenobacter busanensis]